MIFVGGILPILSACDLQPKITSFPDTVGEFINQRYPTLLADPNTQPEIYNSAAADYGVYAAPELYGTYASDTDDYVMYASVNDYILPPADADVVQSVVGNVTDVDNKDTDIVIVTTTDAPDDDRIVVPSRSAASDEYIKVPMYGSIQVVQDTDTITVAAGDTLYALAKKHGTTVEELAKSNKLTAPYGLRVGQTLRVPVQIERVVATPSAPQASSVPVVTNTTTRVPLTSVRVAAGDTLYSISRRYSVPVNDLAVMNNLTSPFALSVGQTLRVPNLAAAGVNTVATQQTQSSSTQQAEKMAITQAAVIKPVVEQKKVEVATPKKTEPQKISSDPTKKLPKMQARSSSKFAWPVRGRVLSHYGAKGNGLVNDGINIGASRGATVVAAENGVVAYAGNEIKGMGNLIIVQHAGGWMTVYAHLDSMAVRRGARVFVGQKIGTVGTTGKVDVPQLHFEIRKGSKAYDPMSQLKK